MNLRFLASYYTLLFPIKLWSNFSFKTYKWTSFFKNSNIFSEFSQKRIFYSKFRYNFLSKVNFFNFSEIVNKPKLSNEHFPKSKYNLYN